MRQSSASNARQTISFRRSSEPMRHEFKTCRCNSTGAFRIAVSLPANSNSGARTFNGWLPTTPRGGTKPTNAAAVWKVNRPDVHTMWIIAAHADEPSPLGVPAHATSNQLDRASRACLTPAALMRMRGI